MPAAVHVAAALLHTSALALPDLKFRLVPRRPPIFLPLHGVDDAARAGRASRVEPEVAPNGAPSHRLAIPVQTSSTQAAILLLLLLTPSCPHRHAGEPASVGAHARAERRLQLGLTFRGSFVATGLSSPRRSATIIALAARAALIRRPPSPRLRSRSVAKLSLRRAVGSAPRVGSGNLRGQRDKFAARRALQN